MDQDQVENVNNYDVFGEHRRAGQLPFEAASENIPQPDTPEGQKFLKEIQKVGGLVLIFLFVIGSLVLLGLKVSQKEPETLAKLPLETVTEVKEASSAATLVVVDLSGAVNSPGLYRLPEGSRLSDLLALGGGISAAADPSWTEKNLNLAEKLADGQKVYIPTKKELLASGGTLAPAVAGGAAVLGAKKAKVNINTASSAMLLNTLQGHGVGQSTADNIVKDREKKGRFQKIEDIQRVSGIKGATFAKIKDLITVD